MEKVITNKNLPTLLLILLPISLLIGTAITEILITIVLIFFLANVILKKEWYIFNNKLFISLLFLWIYLIINYFASVGNENPFFSLRNISFIKFVFFILSIIYFFKKKSEIIYFYWSIILFFVIFDIYFEFIFGHNLLGIKSNDPTRIGSFLGEEKKIGHFILGFAFICLGFILEKINIKKKKTKILILLSFFLIISASFLTGERSNFLRTIFCASIFFLSFNKIFKNKKILIIIFTSFFFYLILNYSQKIQVRYLGQILYEIKNKGFVQTFKETQHAAHFDTALKIFKKNILFGIGNKQFRIECGKEEYFNKELLRSNARCSTHPHQIYLEFLSEHGLIGTTIILTIIFFNIFVNIKYFCKHKNYIHLGTIAFTISIFLPLIPSGSFFTSYSASIFWMNFAVMNYFYLENKIFK
jgi:O-antigen ligase